MKNRSIAVRAAMLFLTVTMVVAANDWPQWLGPERTGISTETGWDRTLSDAELLWHLSEDFPGDHSSPAVVGDRCYIFGRVRGESCVLLCLDPHTGSTIWKQSYKTEKGTKVNAHATPTVSGGSVFTYDSSGHLRCWDASDGTLRWNRDLNKERGAFTYWHGMTSSPLVYQGKVYVSFMRLIEDEEERETFLAQKPPHYRMPGWRPKGVPEVHAFDARTGADVWMNDTDGAGKFPSMVVGVVDNKPTIVINTSSGAVGLDPETGKAHWVYDSYSDNQKKQDQRTTFSSPSTPTIVGNDRVVFRKVRGGPVCVQITEGAVTVLWDRHGMLTRQERKKERPIYYHTSIVLDDMVLVPLHGDSGKVRTSLLALDVADGKKLWRKDEIGGADKLGGCFTVVDGTVLFRSGNRIVSLDVDRSGAEVLGQLTLPGEEYERGWPYSNLPVLANGRLFVRSGTRWNASMSCFDCRLNKPGTDSKGNSQR